MPPRVAQQQDSRPRDRRQHAAAVAQPRPRDSRPRDSRQHAAALAGGRTADEQAAAEALARDAHLEERESTIAELDVKCGRLMAEVQRLREDAHQRDALVASLQAELASEKRTSERYLDEITQQEKMLTMICAYRTDDERRDASRLLQENLGLEERVRQLKLQVKRLAVVNVEGLDEDNL